MAGTEPKAGEVVWGPPQITWVKEYIEELKADTLLLRCALVAVMNHPALDGASDVDDRIAAANAAYEVSAALRDRPRAAYAMLGRPVEVAGCALPTDSHIGNDPPRSITR